MKTNNKHIVALFNLLANSKLIDSVTIEFNRITLDIPHFRGNNYIHSVSYTYLGYVTCTIRLWYKIVKHKIGVKYEKLQ